MDMDVEGKLVYGTIYNTYNLSLLKRRSKEREAGAEGISRPEQQQRRSSTAADYWANQLLIFWIWPRKIIFFRIQLQDYEF